MRLCVQINFASEGSGSIWSTHTAQRALPYYLASYLGIYHSSRQNKMAGKPANRFIIFPPLSPDFSGAPPTDAHGTTRQFYRDSGTNMLVFSPNPHGSSRMCAQLDVVVGFASIHRFVVAGLAVPEYRCHVDVRT